jgi:DNA-binding PadR family transcriptional regulator
MLGTVMGSWFLAALEVQQGSLYAALHRLEKRCWLRAEWRRTETGREAKFYVLTPTGRKRLVYANERARKGGSIS